MANLFLAALIINGNASVKNRRTRLMLAVTVQYITRA
jgi:hypothetical protein